MKNNFSTKYGRFSSTGDEYIITNYKTPRPWVNVLSNGDYGMVISQTGGGFSWKSHSEYNRLNRWHQDLIQDNWGKYFYIKNNTTGEIWSPTWMPVKVNLDEYECRHGFGYTSFYTSFKNIKITVTIFIPVNESIEIWDFKIENNSDEKVSLSIYSYFEWCLGSSADHHREFHKAFVETEFDETINAMVATKRLWEIPLGDRGHWNIEYPYLGFISSNKKIVDYEGDKEAFLGNLGTIQLPSGLSKSMLTKSTGKWNDSVAVVKIDSEINSNEADNPAFFIGIKESKEKITDSIIKFYDGEKRKQALNEVKQFWNEKFDTLIIETPDEAMNLLVNKWLKYQAIAGRLWARTAYYQQSGAYGFRDQLQDSLIFLTIDPSLTEKQIKLHARHQLEDGTVLHWWHPITEQGLETKMTDDLLWLPFVILLYLDETQNYEILNESEPYYNNPNKPDTIFNHCLAAIEKVLSRFSERGLPLIGAGDWNDGLSAVGLEMKGESVWLAEFLYFILSNFSRICNKIGENSISERYKLKAEKLRGSFNKYCWDGNWFFRATKDNGEKIGSHINIDGKIFLNPQTWAVISNISDIRKLRTAMDSVTKNLLRKNGPLLLQPAYHKPDKYVGYLSRYAPGRRENGGVYTHAATWAIWAYSILKDGQNTYKSFKNICPVYNGLNPDEYKAEPFVTPGNIEGPDSPYYGMGGWTWYTGSAAWYQKVIVDNLLGIKATPDGLLIDPCIPPEWNEYKVKRVFRGTTYFIHIINKNNVSSDVDCIRIDGEEFNTNLILPQEKEKVEVTVCMK